MIGRAVGFGFATARDAVARGLVRLGVTPDTLSLAGMALTVLAGACYAAGAATPAPAASLRLAPGEGGAWLLLAAGLLVLSSACDMLDGAVARIGKKATRFGAFLDSTLDRFSDFAVYAGIAFHYAWHAPPNLTFVAGSMVAFFNAVMISYTRARAEDLIDSCSVGYWQRGERSAAILIASFAHNVPALIVQQATLPLLTVLRRIGHTRAVLAGRTPATDPRNGPWHLRVRLWRWPRMSVPYDLVTGLNIAWLIFAPVGDVDPLRRLVEALAGA